MKLFNPWLLPALATCWPGVARAQLQLLPDREPQQMFAGDARKIAVVWRNTGQQSASAEIHTRLFQTTSATAVRLGDYLWKNLQVLPGQTVLESAQMDFPDVKVETQFLVQWLADTNRVIGVTRVRVYPTNLLGQLQMLAKDRSLGVLDPQNQLKPLLKNSKVDFVDLGNSELEHFPGKLAIIGPFVSKAQVPEGLAKRIKVLAQSGAGVVWLLPPDAGEKLQPSYYLVPEGLGMVVVAQSALVSDLPANPESQLHLLNFCELALQPQFLTLPDLSPPS